MAQVKSVKFGQPMSLLVAGFRRSSHWRVCTSALRRTQAPPHTPRELINQSGQTVNIPHVLATFYDDSGKVIWVSTAMWTSVVAAIPLQFAVNARDVAGQVQNYRVTVNNYSVDRS